MSNIEVQHVRHPTQILIESLKRRTLETEHVGVYDAIKYAYKQKWLTSDRYNLARDFLNAEAYVDAALTLMPEDWAGDIEFSIDPPSNIFGVDIWPLDEHCDSVKSGLQQSFAIAICIAALKARQQEEKKETD